MSAVTSMIEEIKRVLDEIAAKYRDQLDVSDKEWTRCVLTNIGRVGQQKGYFVYADVRKDGRPVLNDGEWLFDLCWLNYSDDQNQKWLIRAPLVLECEWGSTKNITDDFQKLLLARADLRVMVFSGRTNSLTLKTAELLKTFTKKYTATSSDDHYLLCGWSGENRRFHFEHI